MESMSFEIQSWQDLKSQEICTLSCLRNRSIIFINKLYFLLIVSHFQKSPMKKAWKRSQFLALFHFNKISKNPLNIYTFMQKST